MFSYFSSSKAPAEDENAKIDEGVTAVRTSTTEQSYISDDESNTREPLSSSLSTKCTTWNQAHDVYCSKHGTLKASIRQILGENREIPWALPKRDDANVAVEAKEVVDILQSRRIKSTPTSVGTPMKSSITRTLLLSPLKVVSAVASVTASMMRDPDDDEWVQEGDDAFTDDGADSSTYLDLNIPIINLNRTESAVECLERTIDQIAQETPLVMALSEWKSWADSSFSKTSSFSDFKFALHDYDFLLQLLVDLKRARIVQRENSKAKGTDVVILTSQTVEDERNGSLPENIRIALSLWDIQKAEATIERKLVEWSDQAAECTKKALMYKKRNQIQMAKTQIAKRKMIQKRMDADSRLQLKLLETRNAIESAQSNRSMIDLMADSTKILRQLREQTPLEEIDDFVRFLSFL